MTRINKSFYTLTAFILFLSVISIIAFYKYLPLVLYHSVYYCETILTQVSINHHSLISWIALVSTSVILAIVITKALFLCLHIRKLHKDLTDFKDAPSSMQLLLQKLNLQNRVHIVECVKPFAYCLGFVNPAIYMSTGLIRLMEEKELEAILLHEQYHLEHRDTLKMFFAFIFQHIFPFIPIITDMIHNYRIEREIKADQAAIEALQDKAPLITVLRKLLIAQTNPTFCTAAIADCDTFEPRINALLERDYNYKRYHALNIVISILSLVVMLAILITPVEAFQEHTNLTSNVGACASARECSTTCKEAINEQKSSTPQSHYSIFPRSSTIIETH